MIQKIELFFLIKLNKIIMVCLTYQESHILKENRKAFSEDGISMF